MSLRGSVAGISDVLDHRNPELAAFDPFHTDHPANENVYDNARLDRVFPHHIQSHGMEILPTTVGDELLAVRDQGFTAQTPRPCFDFLIPLLGYSLSRIRGVGCWQVMENERIVFLERKELLEGFVHSRQKSANQVV